MAWRAPHLVLNAAHWLDRAEFAQTMAANMMLPHTRLQMLKLAENYRCMAKVARQYCKHTRDSRLEPHEDC
jgi:hypothetical protein